MAKTKAEREEMERFRANVIKCLEKRGRAMYMHQIERALGQKNISCRIANMVKLGILQNKQGSMYDKNYNLMNVYFISKTKKTEIINSAPLLCELMGIAVPDITGDVVEYHLSDSTTPGDGQKNTYGFGIRSCLG